MMKEEKTNEVKAEEVKKKREKVRMIPLNLIDDIPNHPFKVRHDEEMEALTESISNYGLLSPIIVRSKKEGRYEIISGHRRKSACEMLGDELIPCIVRNVSDEEAIIMMVDSNLHRERILPSEKAFAYKMKMDAIKCQGKRNDLTCVPLAHKSEGEKSRDTVAKDTGESPDQIRRYIRLTSLTPELLDLVDEGRIAFTPAVQLSFLTEEEQRDLLDTIDSEDATPSLAQAMRMKKLSQEGKLDMDTIFSIMTEPKGNQKTFYKFPREMLAPFFPEYLTPMEVVRGVIEKLTSYQKLMQKKNHNEENFTTLL